MSYDHRKVEKKWQKYWEDEKLYVTDLNDVEKPKAYILGMIPYPSGSGLHVGHPEGYTATDIMARYQRMNNYNVLHPMGWDGFGLPAEQYAIKTGNPPEQFTLENIKTFKKQLKSLGLSYDWSKEINTTDPHYYKWTQWIFIQLYEKGLAEIIDTEVNWCEELGTVLANEEIVNIDGKMVSERGHFPVVKKFMKQWVLKITQYAERLLEGLDDLDWPDSVKEMQRNWIGKSEGATINFPVVDHDETIEVYTSRPDTIFGLSYVVLAPEHPLVDKLVTKEHKKAVKAYRDKTKMKSDLERGELNKDKTGEFIGAYVTNPVNNEEVPVWIADYVLYNYGTGAVMAVPGHDERDYEFAQKYDLPIKYIIEGSKKNVNIEDGAHINSAFLDGLHNEAAKTKAITWLERKHHGKRAVNYKLRDWIFARQRYWGEPFPVIHYEDGTIELVDEKDLPVVLPAMTNYKPAGDGQPPLAKAKKWVKVKRDDGVVGYRDTNTMPQWAGSCWYYIAYLMKNGNDYLALDSPEVKKLAEHWLPVDLYIGGAEHAVLHLLYARFWHKVLFDCGVVASDEPFQKLYNQGMILGTDNRKMSKSLGNVINPNDIVQSHGADTLRLYEMFMGPLDQTKPWSEAGLDGARKFIDRVYRLFTEKVKLKEDNDNKLDTIYHQTIKKVTEDFKTLNYNTAISQMMIFINEAYQHDEMYDEYAIGFIKVFFTICPHVGSELYQLLGYKDVLDYTEWPTYDEALTIEENITIVVQVNGKVRAKIETERNIAEGDFKTLAYANDNVNSHVEGKEIVKEIFVANKLLNIVVK